MWSHRILTHTQITSPAILHWSSNTGSQKHFYSPWDSRDTPLRWLLVFTTSTLDVLKEWQISKNWGVSNPDDSSVSPFNIVCQNWEDKRNLWKARYSRSSQPRFITDDYIPVFYRGKQLRPGAWRPINHSLHRGAPVFIRPLSAFCRQILPYCDVSTEKVKIW